MNDCISVVIPVYNGEATLRIAVDSAVKQDYVKEILIIDDASEDDTPEVASSLAKSNPKITYVRNESNCGAAASRNRGVQLSSGDYVAFLDADDYWAEGKLREQLLLMQEEHAVLCSTARELIRADGESTGRVIPIRSRITYKDLLKHNSLSCSAVLARRDALLEFPMEHEDSHEDYITWIQIVQKYGYAVGINKPYLKYRMSSSSKSGTKLKSARMTFKAYRYAGLSVPKSIRCFLSYTWNGIYKYYLYKKSRLALGCLLCLAVLALIAAGGLQLYRHRTRISDLNSDPILIAHSLGGIEGGKYSNSLEAFELNYKNGMRVFEADFSWTSDHIMVLRHDWERELGQEGLLKYDGYVPTYEEFMGTPLYGKYTPLSLADLLNLMKKHKDIYVITDSKDTEPQQVAEDFETILETAQELDALECMDRFIVQIYNDEMYDAITGVYPFEHFIYTLYLRGTDNFEEVCIFCSERKIPVITIQYKKYTEEFQTLADSYGLKIYLHTVNKKKDALNFYESGVAGFYTEKITPALFE